MSHLRLMKDDDTTIADGQHELYVYNVRLSVLASNNFYYMYSTCLYMYMYM